MSGDHNNSMSTNSDQNHKPSREMTDIEIHNFGPILEYLSAHSVENGPTGSTENETLDTQTTNVTAAVTTDDIALREGRGYFGFHSMEDVNDYMTVIIPERDNRVMLLRPKRSYTESGTLTVIIPTVTRGHLLCDLVPDAGHEKIILEFNDRRAEEDAELRDLLLMDMSIDAAMAMLNANRSTRLQDKNHQSSNHIHIATPAMARDSKQLFGRWWLSSGGKFRLIEHSTPSDTAPMLSEQETEEWLDLDVNSAFIDGYPEQLDVDMLNLDTDIELAQLLASVTQPEESQTSGLVTSGPAIVSAHTVTLLGRRQPEGAFRIWREMGMKLTPIMTSPDRHDHPIYSHAPPGCVDIRLLSDVYVTALELLTFFPSHVSYWPNFLHRLIAAGWKNDDICVFIHLVRQALAHDKGAGELVARDHSRIRHYRWKLGLKADVVLPLYGDLTLVGWVEPRPDPTIGRGLCNQLIDYYVSDLADGVPLEVFPVGENAGPLTDIIRYVRTNPQLPECQTLKLSDVSGFAKHMGIFRTPEQAGLYTGNHPDYVHADQAALRPLADLLEHEGTRIAWKAAYPLREPPKNSFRRHNVRLKMLYTASCDLPCSQVSNCNFPGMIFGD